MVRDIIKGFHRDYTIDELKNIPQYKYPFGIPENEDIFYYQNMESNELEGETFKKSFLYFQYPVEVSNYGRIRYKGCILLQEDNINDHPNGGWLWLNCPEFKVLHHKYIYQLVADTWLGRNPGTIGNWYIRHHINNNGYDNRPENLIWLTSDEHKLIPLPNYIKTLPYQKGGINEL